MVISAALKEWLTLTSPLLCARHSLTHTLAHFTFIKRTMKVPLRQVERWAGVLSDLAFPRHLGSKTNNISDTFDMKNRRLVEV